MNWIKGQPILREIATECILVTADLRFGTSSISMYFVQEFIDFDTDDYYHWGIGEEQNDDEEVDLPYVDYYMILDYPERSKK